MRQCARISDVQQSIQPRPARANNTRFSFVSTVKDVTNGSSNVSCPSVVRVGVCSRKLAFSAGAGRTPCTVHFHVALVGRDPIGRGTGAALPTIADRFSGDFGANLAGRPRGSIGILGTGMGNCIRAAPLAWSIKRGSTPQRNTQVRPPSI